MPFYRVMDRLGQPCGNFRLFRRDDILWLARYNSVDAWRGGHRTKWYNRHHCRNGESLPSEEDRMFLNIWVPYQYQSKLFQVPYFIHKITSERRTGLATRISSFCRYIIHRKVYNVSILVEPVLRGPRCFMIKSGKAF